MKKQEKSKAKAFAKSIQKIRKARGLCPCCGREMPKTGAKV